MLQVYAKGATGIRENELESAQRCDAELKEAAEAVNAKKGSNNDPLPICTRQTHALRGRVGINVVNGAVRLAARGLTMSAEQAR